MIVFLCITVSWLVQYLLCSAAISQFQSCLYFCLLLLVAWCNICFAPSHLKVSVLIVFLCIIVGCLVQNLLGSATVTKFQSWLYFCVLLLVVWCNICFALPLSQRFNASCISVYYYWLFGAIFALLRPWLYFSVLLLVVWCNICFALSLSQSFSPDCISVYYCWLFGATFALLCHSLKVSVLIVFLCITAGCLVQYFLCSVTVSQFQSWLYFCVLLLVVWCNICFALPLSWSFSHDCISVYYCWLFGAIFALLRHSLKVSVLVVFLCITVGCLVQYLLCSVTVSKFQSWLYFCVLLLVAWCNICFALPLFQSFSPDCIFVYYCWMLGALLLSQSFCPDCIFVSYCWLFGAIFSLLRHSLKVSVLVVFLFIN